MRALSLTMRRSLSDQESGNVAIVLLQIYHPLIPNGILLSSDPTMLVTDTPLQYGTLSRGGLFLYFPFSISLPDDVGERAPVAQIQIENVSRNLISLLRSTTVRAKVTIEIVMSSTPNLVEVAFPQFDLTGVTYDASIVTLELGIDSLATEPFPAGKFNPAGFPGLFT